MHGHEARCRSTTAHLLYPALLRDTARCFVPSPPSPCYRHPVSHLSLRECLLTKWYCRRKRVAEMKAADRTQNQGLCTLTSTIANGRLARIGGRCILPCDCCCSTDRTVAACHNICISPRRLPDGRLAPSEACFGAHKDTRGADVHPEHIFCGAGSVLA